MRHLFFLTVLALSAMTANSTTVNGGELSVIAHQDIKADEIESGDLRAIFLGMKTSLRNGGGTEVQPVLNKAQGALAEFATGMLGKSPSALQTYYRSLVFTGRWSMPVTLNSDAETVNYVARTKGSIGFVRPGAALRPGVKTLRIR